MRFWEKNEIGKVSRVYGELHSQTSTGLYPTLNGATLNILLREWFYMII